MLVALRIERGYAVYQSGLSDYEAGSAEFQSLYYNNIYVKEDDDAFLSYLYAFIALLVYFLPWASNQDDNTHVKRLHNFHGPSDRDLSYLLNDWLYTL